MASVWPRHVLALLAVTVALFVQDRQRLSSTMADAFAVYNDVLTL